MIDGSLEQLQALLTLKPLGGDRFRNQFTHEGRGRLFGGEVLAQALRAAQHTTAGRPVHSVHAYFIRAGDAKVNVDYQVHRLRDGRSFSARRIDALQKGQIIFVMDASFHAPEEGFQHQTTMPSVPAPESLPTDAERFAEAKRLHPQLFTQSFYSGAGPFDTRTVEDLMNPDRHPPHANVWVRARGKVADSEMAAAMLLYYSDETIVDNCILPHAGRLNWNDISSVSLDHAMWFHQPFRIDEWLLFTQDSPIAHGSRGFNRGSFFNRSGLLIASVTQEGLLRARSSEQK